MFININSGCERQFQIRIFYLDVCDVIFIPVLCPLSFIVIFFLDYVSHKIIVCFLPFIVTFMQVLCWLLFIKYVSKLNLPCLFFHYMSWLKTGVRRTRSWRSFHVISRSFNISKLWCSKYTHEKYNRLLHKLRHRSFSATQVYQIQWNNAMQPPLRRSRSFKVTDFGTNRKLIYDILSCTVTKLWLIIGQSFANESGVSHFIALAVGDPVQYRHKWYIAKN